MLLNHYVTVRDEVYATAALRVRQSALLGVDDGAAFRRTRSDERFPPPAGPARSPGRGYATTPHRRPTTRVRAGVFDKRQSGRARVSESTAGRVQSSKQRFGRSETSSEAIC